MKETLRVAFIDFWPEWPDEDFVTPILSKKFDVIMDAKRPDVVFHSVFGTNANRYTCKKVLYLGENKRYQDYTTDYTITFEPHTDTNFRLPLWQVYMLKNPTILPRLLDRVHHDSFERFCSFTVSNGGNFTRNGVFQQLNSYKRVHSYGRHMTNDPTLLQASIGRYWRDAKDEYFQQHTHKFAIAYENNPHKYYCTEKLMDAFLAGSIPIYWGDVRVGEDWNTDAFINGTKMGSGAMDLVKRIDHDRELFEEMYSQPVFTEGQAMKMSENLKTFEGWLVEITSK